jgi:beta-lactamase superfamily II metal-dependent hydrolase
MNQLEIDMLAVGDGEKSGDAIAYRFGDFSDTQKQYVVVVDGGSKESGEKLVSLIKEHYNTSFVDLIISTHPDSDHTSGLRVVMEELTVGNLWMHLPWEHSERIRNLFKDGRITDESLKERLRKAYRYAYELEKLAIENDVPITEPFTGTNFLNGTIRVLGPTEDYYEELLVDSAKSPETKNEGLAGTSIGRTFSTVKSAVLSWIEETFDIELLDESGETSPENNSSVVSLLTFDDKKYLFTGDAGVPALENVIVFTDANGIDISQVNWKQVPHHGSHRNISPSVLDKIKTTTAFVSAAKGATKHPSYKVTNAYIRRGASVYTTEGINMHHRSNCESRSGYGPASAYTFKDRVQE